MLSDSGRGFLTACLALVVDVVLLRLGTSNPLIRLIGAYLTESSAFLGCLVGLGMRTFGNMLVLEFGLSIRPAFRKPGSERRASHRDVLLA